MMSEATQNSLVLIDELGRGTSTWDGAAIARAVLNHFVSNVKCLTVFVTHYKSLTSDEAVAVRNGHMSYCRRSGDEDVGEGEEKDSRVLFLYKLTEGPCESSFGINVAEMAGLPKSITNLAAKLAIDYEQADGASCAPV